MIHILENSSQRVLEILTILLKNSNSTSIKDLSTQLSVSEKTIQEDLNTIKDSWNHQVGLEFLRDNKIKAKKITAINLLNIQSTILLNSIPIKLLKSIFYHPNEELSYYAERLHVSRSTLYRYLPRLNNYLKQFAITIENKNHRYQLISDNELGLRRFFSTLFLEISGYNIEVFVPHEEIFFLHNRLLMIHKVNKQKISNIQIHYYLTIYFVSIYREKQGFRIEHSKYFNGILPSFTEEENDFLQKNIGLEVMDLYRVEDSFFILRHSFNSYSDEHFEKTIPNFLNKIYQKFNLNMNLNEFQEVLFYLNDLYLNIKFIGIPFHLVNNRFTYFSQEIYKDNNYIYESIKELVAVLSYETSLNFTRDLDYIIYILITSLPNILLTSTKKKLLIVSSYSIEHSNFLLNFFQKELNFTPKDPKNINCTSKNMLNKVNFSDYDLIISNTFLIDDLKNIIIVSDYPSSTDLSSIKSVLID